MTPALFMKQSTYQYKIEGRKEKHSFYWEEWKPSLIIYYFTKKNFTKISAILRYEGYLCSNQIHFHKNISVVQFSNMYTLLVFFCTPFVFKSFCILNWIHIPQNKPKSKIRSPTLKFLRKVYYNITRCWRIKRIRRTVNREEKYE